MGGAILQGGGGPCLRERGDSGTVPPPGESVDPSPKTEVGSGNVPAALLGDVGGIQIYTRECGHVEGEEALYSYCDAEKERTRPSASTGGLSTSTSTSTSGTQETTESGVGKGREEEEGEEVVVPVDPKSQAFMDELYKIDKDIPRCDRDFW